MGRAEDALTGLVPKMERMEERQQTSITEQARQGEILDELRDEQVGRVHTGRWRRNALAWGVGLAVILSALLSILALLVTR